MKAVDAFPAIAPPLPPVLAAVFWLSPVADTVRSPLREVPVVIPVPSCASVAAWPVAVDTAAPTPTKPMAIAVASAFWRVVPVATTVTSPSGSRTLLPMLLVTLPPPSAVAPAPPTP